MMSQSTEDNHEKMKDTERIKWVWISYIAETLAASNSAVDWQFTIKFTNPGYRPGRAASARQALVRLATSTQGWRRGGRGRPYGSSFRRPGSDVEMPAGAWMRGEDATRHGVAAVLAGCSCRRPGMEMWRREVDLERRAGG